MTPKFPLHSYSSKPSTLRNVQNSPKQLVSRIAWLQLLSIQYLCAPWNNSVSVFYLSYNYWYICTKWYVNQISLFNKSIRIYSHYYFCNTVFHNRFLSSFSFLKKSLVVHQRIFSVGMTIRNESTLTPAALYLIYLTHNRVAAHFFFSNITTITETKAPNYQHFPTYCNWLFFCHFLARIDESKMKKIIVSKYFGARWVNFKKQ